MFYEAENERAGDYSQSQQMSRAAQRQYVGRRATRSECMNVGPAAPGVRGVNGRAAAGQAECLCSAGLSGSAFAIGRRQMCPQS
jgi:hypothetical protein